MSIIRKIKQQHEVECKNMSFILHRRVLGMRNSRYSGTVSLREHFLALGLWWCSGEDVIGYCSCASIIEIGFPHSLIPKPLTHSLTSKRSTSLLCRMRTCSSGDPGGDLCWHVCWWRCLMWAMLRWWYVQRVSNRVVSAITITHTPHSTFYFPCSAFICRMRTGSSGDPGGDLCWHVCWWRCLMWAMLRWWYVQRVSNRVVSAITITHTPHSIFYFPCSAFI